MSPAAPAPARKRGRPPGNAALREELLLAAVRAFGARGFDGASLGQIAKAAGADVGLIRYYFGAKLDLWKAAVDFLAEQFETALPDLEALPTATERARAVVRTFVYRSARWPQVSRIIVFDGNDAGERSDYVRERMVSPFYDLLTGLIEDAKAEGSLPDVSPRTIFFMITHGGSFPMALPALTNAFPGGDIGDEASLDAHAESIVALLFRRSGG